MWKEGVKMIVIEKHALTHLLRRKERLEDALQLFALYQVKSLFELKVTMQKDLDEINNIIKELTR